MNEHDALRDAWTDTITTEDYEKHMAGVGQAQANASLTAKLFQTWPPNGNQVLIVGAGAGQMFDYLDSALFTPYHVVFTDISASFLGRLRSRLEHHQLTDFEVHQDDFEDTRLTGPFAAALVTLVLEHIDWRQGVTSLARLNPSRCYLIIQVNPPEMTQAVTPGVKPPGTMEIFVNTRPHLVPRTELIDAMQANGFMLEASEAHAVPHGKTMLALIFNRSG